MHQISKSKIMILAGLFSVVMLFTGIHSAIAYQTDMEDPLLNKFTIALDSTSTVVEKYPEKTPPTINPTAIQYEKTVQFGNTGYIDCYIRARLDFTEDDIDNKSSMSSDGNTYYKFNDYKSHLPSGWTYNNADGYFYYKNIVYAEDWENTAKKLTYDKGLGEYFYPTNQAIMTKSCLTTPLVRYIKTEFTEPKDMRTYYLNVYCESVPFYFGNDYSQAWTNYLAN